MKDLYRNIRARYRWLLPHDISEYILVACTVWMLVNAILSFLEGVWPAGVISICFILTSALIYVLLKRLRLNRAYIHYLHRSINFMTENCISKPVFDMGDIVCVDGNNEKHEITGVRFMYNSRADCGWEYQLDGLRWYSGILERYKD